MEFDLDFVPVELIAAISSFPSIFPVAPDPEAVIRYYNTGEFPCLADDEKNDDQ